MLLTGDAGQTRDPSPKPNACAGEMHTPEAAANQDDGGGGGGLARACARQVTFASPSAPPVIQEPGKCHGDGPSFQRRSWRGLAENHHLWPLPTAIWRERRRKKKRLA